ncbi:Dam family site-specific DNA-(adenine-N6)-methyltransferase [Frankia sp. Cj5]|uniref:DNA adenine methylase n=1 Tax=Frankia sp. Cj5 TaxID=2880978 RepID=UPI001EF71781|nr:Dam family site-specific DNA-(adenine-N6)-methyltransferase [Frankia sp. Cj5]
MSPAAGKDTKRLDSPAIVPFLKWPGGKRWLVASHPELFAIKHRRYIEPFLGAGSVFFHIKPECALLADINIDVITAFKGIKMHAEDVTLLLEEYHHKHCNDHYYKVRDDPIPESLAAQAARLIYLNRTCFNGIYRVNRQGRFNVPIGTRTNVVLDTDNFTAVSRMLQKAELRNSDFESIIDEAEEGDLVFLDPPYTVRHNKNGFIKYNETLFSWDDQDRLAKAATRAAERGAQIVVTNASHSTIVQLYGAGRFKFQTVSRFSPISATAKSRRQFEELVIISKRRRRPSGSK